MCYLHAQPRVWYRFVLSNWGAEPDAGYSLRGCWAATKLWGQQQFPCASSWLRCHEVTIPGFKDWRALQILAVISSSMKQIRLQS